MLEEVLVIIVIIEISIINDINTISNNDDDNNDKHTIISMNDDNDNNANNNNNNHSGLSSCRGGEAGLLEERSPAYPKAGHASSWAAPIVTGQSTSCREAWGSSVVWATSLSISHSLCVRKP